MINIFIANEIRFAEQLDFMVGSNINIMENNF